MGPARWRLRPAVGTIPATAVVLVAAALGAATVLAGPLAGVAWARPDRAVADPSALYIVQLAGAPLASYDGTVPGFPATRPSGGRRLDTRTPQADAYRGHLRSQQATVLHAAGIDGRPVYQYDTTFDGAAIRLTREQALRLAKQPGVVEVWKSRTVTLDTITTPAFLGLSGDQGVWERRFGGPENAGAGVIIADIDTGFWPENPSFAALPGPRTDDGVIAAKWHGTCDAGQNHPVTCNTKVIGARWFDAAGNSSANPGEFKSPRDYDGHGSHTASTAAGDNGVPATVGDVAVGDVSGMAPGARLAVYKVLYEAADGTTAEGSDVDIVAAIDQAVSDGADVINYSIGDNNDAFSPVEFAFMQAAAAGVFVSAAAGNAGPDASTVDNAMPWEMTVAAGTHDRDFTKTVTLGNGATYQGAGVGPALASAPLIDSATAALAPHTVDDATICVLGSLDPAKVTGKIVLCQRGTNPRTDKSKAVQQAGGVGMILWNPSDNSLNADFHFVPTIHVDTADGQAIKAYIAGTPGATASLSAGTRVTVEAPSVAPFSSRGPSVSSNGDLLKPDIMAPGNDVIAAVSPVNHNGRLWDTESGTSMATPHIAGIAALIKSVHPDWPPMWIKSALMTTATTLDSKGNPIQGASGAANPLDMGAGQVVPAAAFDPGLIYDSTPTQWLQYGCGIGVRLALSGQDVCGIVGSIAPDQLNYPSIAFGALPGSDKVTREVTNITSRPSVYIADLHAPAGYRAAVSPPVLVMRPGETAAFTVSITRTTAPLATTASPTASPSPSPAASLPPSPSSSPVPSSSPAPSSSASPSFSSPAPSSPASSSSPPPSSSPTPSSSPALPSPSTPSSSSPGPSSSPAPSSSSSAPSSPSITVTVGPSIAASYSFGSLTWRDGSGHRVTSPIAVRPVPLSAPDEATGRGSAGSARIPVRSGYAGTLTASATGLVPDRVDHMSLTPSPGSTFDPTNPQATGRTGEVKITVPAGARLARFATFAGDYPAGTDVDLYVYSVDSDGNPASEIGQSTGDTSDESVTVDGSGTFIVFVDLSSASGSGPIDAKLHSWSLGTRHRGRFTVSPTRQRVLMGGSPTITARWSGLAAGHRYLGLIEYTDGTAILGDTTVLVTG